MSGSDLGTRIKPIAPKEYDGRADARAYHQFVKESEAYLRDGKVKGCRSVFLLLYYLTGQAYNFYTQKVSLNEEEWTLHQFYDEFFNFCFPVDYMMQLQKSLAHCHQNDKSIAEYTHELDELFNMIGDIPERDQVLKFWNGVRPVIQKGLWCDSLNPETSSWDKVVTQAEIIEMWLGIGITSQTHLEGQQITREVAKLKAKTTCPTCQLNQMPMTKCKLTLGLVADSTQDGLSVIKPPQVEVSCCKDGKALVGLEVTVVQLKEVDLKLLVVIDMTPEVLLSSLKRKKQKD